MDLGTKIIVVVGAILLIGFVVVLIKNAMKDGGEL